jgi:ankyrin repeat protein
MKRSLGAAELPVVRPRVPETSDDRDAPVAPAPEEPVPAPLAVANAKPYVRMAFPGPFAYVPRPAAMEDGGANPASAGSASNPREGSGEAGAAPAFTDAGRSQNQVEPAIAAAAASTSTLSGASSTGSVVNAENPNGYPPLILAAFTGNHAALEILMRDPALDIHQRDPRSGMSALGAATVGGHVEMRHRLIAAGAAVDFRRPLAGIADLMDAAAANRPDVVTHLLASGAKVDLVAGKQRRTALMVAAQHGYVEVVKQLVAHKDIVLDQTDANGCSALHLAAEKNKPDVVACLLAAGAKVDLVAGTQRRTALMAAAQNGHVEVVKRLVANKGIALDQTEAKGCSALHFATANNKPEVVACLLAAGAKVDLMVGQRRLTALMMAAQNGHVEVMEKLVAHKDTALDKTDAEGFSALHWAAEKNKPDVIACLLAAGASMTHLDATGRTALMFAIVKKHAAVVEVLVQCGAARPAFHAVDLALPRSVVAFAVTLADLDADRKSPADAQDNPLGLVAPQSLDDSLAGQDQPGVSGRCGDPGRQPGQCRLARAVGASHRHELEIDACRARSRAARHRGGVDHATDQPVCVREYRAQGAAAFFACDTARNRRADASGSATDLDRQCEVGRSAGPAVSSSVRSTQAVLWANRKCKLSNQFLIFRQMPSSGATYKLHLDSPASHFQQEKTNETKPWHRRTPSLANPRSSHIGLSRTPGTDSAASASASACAVE